MLASWERLLAAAVGHSPATILLRSGWQTVNIGDIAHTPGVLRLLQRHCPEAKVILWANALDRGVGPMLAAAFPAVGQVSGQVEKGGRPSTDALREAFAQADLLLHGSGPSLVAQQHVRGFHQATGKPFGVYGTTLEHVEAAQAELLNQARFVFCRETASLQKLAAAGVTRPPVGFAPDGTFAFDLRDDATGHAWLAAHGLAEGGFLCAIPRLRYTPYHLQRKTGWSTEEIQRRTAVNEAHQETDHAKLREVIVRWVRETGRKVLVCPEMTYQLDIIGPLVCDRLPDDVKPRVVRRDTYWMPDEAASIYQQAGAVVSFECHSPIIAAAAGVPCCYLRQPTDTIKGQMWYDIGLRDWVFEIDEVSGGDIAKRVLAIAAQPAAAAAYLKQAMAVVTERQRETMDRVAREAHRA